VGVSVSVSVSVFVFVFEGGYRRSCAWRVLDQRPARPPHPALSLKVRGGRG